MHTTLTLTLDVATRLLCSEVIRHPTMCRAQRVALLKLALDLSAELINEDAKRREGEHARTHAPQPKPSSTPAPPKPTNRYEEIRKAARIIQPHEVDPAWGQPDAANDADAGASDVDQKAPPPRKKFP